MEFPYLHQLAKMIFQQVFNRKNKNMLYETKYGKIKEFKASKYFIWNFKKKYNLLRSQNDINEKKQE